MPVTPPELSAGQLRTARERLRRIDNRRVAQRMHVAGQPIADIALILDVTQHDTRRLLAAARLLGADVSPTEIILRAAVEAGDRSVLVATLSTLTYTATKYGPYPSEGARHGTWDEVRFAYMQGYLSAEEFAAVRAAAKPPPDTYGELHE